MNKEETLQLYGEGVEVWNAWAEKVQAERKALLERGAWAAKVAQLGRLEGDNDATRTWLAAAATDFSDHTFESDLESDFSRFHFPGAARFDKATFSDRAWFDHATFSGEALFNEATFSDRAVFNHATFSREASFNDATFSDFTSFNHATFSDAQFHGAIFSKEASFVEATFSGLARFPWATFSKGAAFGSVTFSGPAAFRFAHFTSGTTFSNARFKKTADFVAVRGESYFSLQGVEFTRVPDFEQAHFDEAPRLDVSHIGPGQREPDVTARWRALKRLALQGHDHERERDFFAEELKSLRGSTDWLLPRLGNLFRPGQRVWPGGARYWMGLFYQAFSNFGRSLVCPVLWWAGLTAAFAVFYLSRYQVPGSVRRPARDLLFSAWGGPLPCVKGQGDAVSAAIYLSAHKGSILAGIGGSDKLAQAYVQIPAHCGHRFRRIADSVPVIADSRR